MSDAAVDLLVIGAGVTGLATAMHVAQSGRSVCIAEQHRRAGMETSTHNSGVIHAGLYCRGNVQVAARAQRDTASARASTTAAC
jgi:L-2-hydroxyglutarate oxidase LhgO